MINETKRSLTNQIKLTRAQYEFLRIRYRRQRNVGATWLVRMAMLEIVSLQAQAELDKTGYVKAADTVIDALENAERERQKNAGGTAEE